MVSMGEDARNTWPFQVDGRPLVREWQLKSRKEPLCSIIASYLFAKSVLQIDRKSGWLHLALYLKQCSSSLQKAYGGSVTPDLSPIPVSLTRSGYPRIIPSFHRRCIYRKDDRADMLVQLYLSYFSLAKRILLAKRIDRSVFESIITPPNVEEISVPYPFTRKWDPTFPPHRITQMILRGFCGVDPKRASKVRSVFTSLPWELACFHFLTTLTMPAQHRWAEKEGVLWPERVRYAFDPNNNMLTFWDFSQYENTVEPHLQSCIELRVIPCIGRLGMALEGAGKRRIFAIGNYVKQRLLKPFHDWLFEVLRRIPMDGTFNQTRPLDYLVGAEHCYSFDLKSATDTDRWPLLFLTDVVKILFGEAWAKGVVNSTLATGRFIVPFCRKRRGSEFYHSVAFQAEQVYPGPRFTNYAVLGDDIVITDSRVAEIYEAQLERLGVTISRQKSLVSHTGALEFAKRFRVRGGRRDLSPVSIRGLLNYFHPYGLMAIHMKYPVKRFSTLARIGGAGYRQLARLYTSPPRRFRQVGAMWTKTLLPFDFWLGRGKSLNPYLKGIILDFLRSEMKPKDLKLAPHEFDPYSEDRDLVEYTAVRSDSGYSMYAGTTCFEGFTPKVGLNQPAAGRGVVYPGPDGTRRFEPYTTVAGMKRSLGTELCCLLGPDGGTGIFGGKKAAPFCGRIEASATKATTIPIYPSPSLHPDNDHLSTSGSRQKEMADGVRRSSLPDRASVLNLPSRDSKGSSEPVKKGNSLASGSGDLGPYLAEMRRFQKRCTKDPAGYFITWTANPSPSFIGVEVFYRVPVLPLVAESLRFESLNVSSIGLVSGVTFWDGALYLKSLLVDLARKPRTDSPGTRTNPWTWGNGNRKERAGCWERADCLPFEAYYYLSFSPLTDLTFTYSQKDGTRKEDCFSEESYGKSVPIDSINKQLSDFEVVEEIEKERVDEPGLQNVMILWILLTLSVIGKT
ncbi:hypothetical protein BUALT_BualtMtG0007500 (mitochondrion) [Buddleja alternifolia]|uniref:RdRp n=1 Tax=Buddleja alternifolia TaxID=168488 RepID=A0AAV6W8B5_9LAMI|nr:hypothetical protein BUALT_BualtMtG0007500 [Buddleja alternifolia]